MFKRSLNALQYPEADTFNINEDNHLKKLIVWLEKNIIKKCKTANFDSLTNIESPSWNNAYNLYKKDVKCRITNNILLDEVEWLLEYSVIQTYKASYLKSDNATPTNTSNTPNIIAENPLDCLDLTNKEFETGVKGLAKLLNIVPHVDNMVTLKAISILLSNRYNETALKNPNDVIIKGTPVSLDSVSFTSDNKNIKVNKAAKALLLVYIKNLRDLQTQANELIVASQKITANPKTDTKLGKVGI